MKITSGNNKFSTGRILLYLLLLASVVAAMMLVRQCTISTRSPYAHAARHSDGDTIDVAIEVSPLLYSLASDTIDGLDYDMLRDFGAAMGRPVKFHPFASISAALDGVEKGRYDIAVSSLPSTREMKERFAMTKPLYIDRQVLVQRKMPGDSLPPITAQHQLAGDTVWLPAGSPFLTRVRLLAKEIGDTIYVEQPRQFSSEQLYILVAAGEIPRAVVNEGVALTMRKNHPDTDISTAMSFAQFQSWAVCNNRKSLADSINTWLAAYRTSSRYEELLHRYLSESDLHRCMPDSM